MSLLANTLSGIGYHRTKYALLHLVSTAHMHERFAIRPDIRFGIFLKRELAARRAEVVRLTLVLGLVLRRLLVDFHTTHWIDCHALPPQE